MPRGVDITFSAWHVTDTRCERGHRLQERTVTTHRDNGDDWVEVETRCCKPCDDETNVSGRGD